MSREPDDLRGVLVCPSCKPVDGRHAPDCTRMSAPEIQPCRCGAPCAVCEQTEIVIAAALDPAQILMLGSVLGLEGGIAGVLVWGHLCAVHRPFFERAIDAAQARLRLARAAHRGPAPVTH